MNKKIEVSKTGIGLLLVIFSCTCSFAQIKVGVQLYSFRNEISKDLPGMMDKISRMGITEIEGGELYGMQPDEYKSVLTKNNLTMIGVHADFNDLDSNLQKVLDRAKMFTAKYVICYWIPHKGNEFGIDDVQKAIKVFNKAGKILKGKGIHFCYHPHGYEFKQYKGESLFDYMVKHFDKRYVNFELDVFWAKHGGADPVALMLKYPNRFPLLHLKDRKIGTIGNENGEADVETNVTLGTGDVNISAIMKVAKKIGVRHYFIEDESSRCLEQVPQSVNYLKSLMQ